MSNPADLTHFETSIDALAGTLAGPPHRLFEIEKYRGGIDALHDLLLEQDVLGEEELMLKCAELRQEMSSQDARQAVGQPSLDALILERAIRGLLTAKGILR